MSLGTGGTIFKQKVATDFTRAKWKLQSLEFMVNADIRATDKSLRRLFKK